MKLKKNAKPAYELTGRGKFYALSNFTTVRIGDRFKLDYQTVNHCRIVEIAKSGVIADIYGPDGTSMGHRMLIEWRQGVSAL